MKKKEVQSIFKEFSIQFFIFHNIKIYLQFKKNEIYNNYPLV